MWEIELKKLKIWWSWFMSAVCKWNEPNVVQNMHQSKRECPYRSGCVKLHIDNKVNDVKAYSYLKNVSECGSYLCDSFDFFISLSCIFNFTFLLENDWKEIHVHMLATHKAYSYKINFSTCFVLKEVFINQKNS